MNLMPKNAGPAARGATVSLPGGYHQVTETVPLPSPAFFGISLLALVFLTLTSFAKAPALDQQLSSIEKTYQKTDTLIVEFVQNTYVPLLEKTVSRPGRIFYERPGKIRIEYAGEKMTHYVSDGTTFWIIHPLDKKIETYPMAEAGLPLEALHFLTELGNLRQYFAVSQNNKGRMVLKPKQKSTYKQLVCTFDAEYYLEDLIIQNLSGNESHYHFFKRRVNQPLPGNLFHP